MGLIERITHKKEIEELVSSAESIYNSAKTNFESQKENTSNSLEELGKTKIRVWSEDMEAFVSSFGAFKNVELTQADLSYSGFLGHNEDPRKIMLNIENASLNAKDILKAGFAAVGTGAIVGVAAYGGAMMFGTASTGTAISALAGAAKTNATLAWFGGGAKVAGGLGKIAGKVVLAGIVIAPILAVAAVIAGIKGKERLEEAKKVYAEAENAASKMNIITTEMRGIEQLSNNYLSFINKLHKKFSPFIKKLESIKNEHAKRYGELIDFDSLSIQEQKVLNISWLMAQIYYKVLSTPILNSNGKVDNNAQQILNITKKDLKLLQRSNDKIIRKELEVEEIYTRPASNIIKILSYIVMAVFTLVGIFTIPSNTLKGFLFLACALLACPIFVYSKKSTSKRMNVSIIIGLILSILSFIVIVIFV